MLGKSRVWTTYIQCARQFFFLFQIFLLCAKIIFFSFSVFVFALTAFFNAPAHCCAWLCLLISFFFSAPLFCMDINIAYTNKHRNSFHLFSCALFVYSLTCIFIPLFICLRCDTLSKHCNSYIFLYPHSPLCVFLRTCLQQMYTHFFWY